MIHFITFNISEFVFAEDNEKHNKKTEKYRGQIA